jgi:uncharacterized protein
MRDAGNINSPRNWPKVKGILENLNSNFTVFGGEPLLAPIEHLEEVWLFGFERFGRNGIQTNGVLINDAHIALFQKYNVEIGISVDGPGELNSMRSTLAETEATLGAIKKLCDLGIPTSLIVTMTRQNMRFPELTDWLDTLLSWGIRHLNFHILEIECGMESLLLSEEENITAFLELYKWSRARNVPSQPFYDIYQLLTQEKPNVSCVWNHCDPATTAAVQGISPDGVMSNCGRTNKDGIDWVKADKPGFERYLLLHQTPQDVGGCKGCTFFVFCKGQCPGTAIDGDWRNRTTDCKLWYTLFQKIEADIAAEGKLPISANCEVKARIEKEYLEIWMGNEQPNHGDSPHGDQHGDSHGDRPHGDGHGDSGSKIPAILLDHDPTQL